MATEKIKRVTDAFLEGDSIDAIMNTLSNDADVIDDVDVNKLIKGRDFPVLRNNTSYRKNPKRTKEFTHHKVSPLMSISMLQKVLTDYIGAVIDDGGEGYIKFTDTDGIYIYKKLKKYVAVDWDVTIPIANCPNLFIEYTFPLLVRKIVTYAKNIGTTKGDPNLSYKTFSYGVYFYDKDKTTADVTIDIKSTDPVLTDVDNDGIPELPESTALVPVSTALVPAKRTPSVKAKRSTRAKHVRESANKTPLSDRMALARRKGLSKKVSLSDRYSRKSRKSSVVESRVPRSKKSLFEKKLDRKGLPSVERKPRSKSNIKESRAAKVMLAKKGSLTKAERVMERHSGGAKSRLSESKKSVKPTFYERTKAKERLSKKFR